ncbi:MAG: Lrp/AsnC family transcriptional regulator [SAR324 cluster bacterium]|nr:Lrp/AsnC family transcriptional regulator [SAR324 cluster bacterium]
MKEVQLTELEKKFINLFQRDFPLTARPFEAIAQQLGLTESEVLEMAEKLQGNEVISRIGAVIKPGKVGASTLAAMPVPPRELKEVAAKISSLPEITHNYEREHELYTLWFVVTAHSDWHLQQVLERIQQQTGYDVMSLPLKREYHIDLGFSV